MILSAGSTIARASSGSRSCINSIEPLISANSAVTVLPSSSTVVEAPLHSAVIGMSGVPQENSSKLAVALLAESAHPQSPQNRLLGGIGVPHLEQRFASGAPQSPQNCLLGRFSPSHLEQRIDSP